MTTFEKVSLVFTAVQTIAVVVTLLALWKQLKQFNRNMEDSAYAQHLDDYSRLTQLLIDKPALNDIFYSNAAHFRQLSANEKDFYNYIALAFGFLERLWTLHQKKMIDDHTWKTWDEWFEEQWFPLQVFDIFWQNEGRYFHGGFHDYIELKYNSFNTKRAPKAMSQ
jgi:hypothetical protein